MQDTIRQKILTGSDSLKGLPAGISVKTDTLRKTYQVISKADNKPVITDTVSDCSRNVPANVTFSDSTSFVRNMITLIPEGFPFTFMDTNRIILEKQQTLLYKSLREGQQIPADGFRSDWIVPLLFFSALLLGIVRSVRGNLFRNMYRFLFLRGINENASRDTGTLFQWQSTLMNLSGFMSISMFSYLATIYFFPDFTVSGRIIIWLVCFGTVISAVTLRHLVCNLTGKISDEQAVFKEYLLTIYQCYRFAGIISLILSFLVLYTKVIPEKILFESGFAVIGALYLLRVIRLILIFIIRRVSILYLILYLCALEILPVVILVKYVTGLV